MKRITKRKRCHSVVISLEHHSLFLLYTDRGGITSVKVWRVIKKNRNSINLSIELPRVPFETGRFFLFPFFSPPFSPDEVWTMKASLGCRGISLKSESICLITGYVVVLLGFRFLLLFLLLLLAFYALHQPRVSAHEITYISHVFIHLIFFFLLDFVCRTESLFNFLFSWNFR